LYIFHRCTRVENPGEGVAEAYSKILGGGGEGYVFHNKLPMGAPYFGLLTFITFLITSFFWKFAYGILYYTLLPPSPPWVHLWMFSTPVLKTSLVFVRKKCFGTNIFSKQFRFDVGNWFTTEQLYF
jgi:hypothetical protein